MNNDFGGGGGGQLGGAELAIMLVVYGLMFLVIVGIQVLVCWLLYRAADSIPEQYREATPGMAFLMLIPLFNLVWIFIYTKQLSRSFQHLFSAIGQHQGDCGESMGMWWGICAVGGLIPCIGAIPGMASLVLMIVYLVKVSQCRNVALATSGNVVT